MELKCGMAPKTIAETTEHSRGHIEKMRRNLWQWGSVTILRLAKLRASRLLTAAMTEVDAGVILAYLSPYSPNYNPIEKSFNELKT
jgi:transposase